jgi:exopolyphosphatase/guanosine-5'-triphosphate,3'-diphosphate pyrophosphatase
MKLAAIDVGSNSIHLVVLDAVAGQHPQLIDREKEMVRLGAGTLREHRLSRETIERAIGTLKRFRKVAEGNKVERIIAIATSAVRESRNADDFVERVRREVGIDVRILPGVEEARLIALAVSEVTDFGDRRALIIDIGGGSTELILTNGGEPQLLLSIKMGSVRLSEKFITTDPVKTDELERLRSTIRSDLTRAVWEIKNTGFDFVVGTSGTILNMADAIVQANSPRPPHSVTGIEPFSETVTLEQISEMNKYLAGLTLKQRARVPGLEKRRADIIIAGGTLLECIMAELGADQITTCDWSLREGAVLNHLRARDSKKGTRAKPRSEYPAILDPAADDSHLDVRSRSVLSVARRYEYDAAHSNHVARFAIRIFDDTRKLHRMGAAERNLLLYAALLHDIGYHIAHNNHHRHAAYLIRNSEMPGFAGPDIAMMAMLVRYHRGSMPDTGGGSRARRENEDYYALERPLRENALRMASMLQIADGLDRSHRLNVREIRCKVGRKRVTFLARCEDESDLELWSAERKGVWFAELFGVQLRFKREKSKESKEAEASEEPREIQARFIST